MSFSILDVETTGIMPEYHHRIIEIAIIRVNQKGQVTHTYETLVNPKRDLGPTHIHGIMGEDIDGAPTFSEIAGDVLALLKNTTVVAHNASFDVKFLLSELQRCGLPINHIPNQCTLQLSRQAWPGLKQRSLESLCKALNITHKQKHAALSDAKATLDLFLKAKAKLRNFDCGATAIGSDWPNVNPSGKIKTRHDNQGPLTPPSFLEGLVDKGPGSEDNSQKIDTYLSFLDQVLLDRVMTDQESKSLLLLIKDLGLDLHQAQKAHERYVRDLIWYALEDNVITDREYRDLSMVSRLLAISNTQLDQWIAEMESGAMPEQMMVHSNDYRGKTVCFTGKLICRYQGQLMTRTIAEKLATDAGMVIAKSVTKKCDVLVVADPKTQSSKAEKARRYEIPILSEVAFWLKLGVEVQ